MPLYMRCPVGQSVTGVRYAEWGLTTTTCRKGVPKQAAESSCVASGIATSIMDKCGSLQQCRIGSPDITSDFGDPCPGTRKSFVAFYNCSYVAPSTPHSGQFCVTGDEKDGMVKFTCPVSGDVIKKINYAYYGRPTGTCRRGHEASKMCNSDRAFTAVSTMCLGSSSCIIGEFPDTMNALFGDPCPSREKRLAISLVCGKP